MLTIPMMLFLASVSPSAAVLQPPRAAPVGADTLVHRLQLAPPATATRSSTCQRLRGPVDGETGMHCSGHAAHLARAFWRAPVSRALRGHTLALATAWRVAERPELRPEQRLSPWIGLELKLGASTGR